MPERLSGESARIDAAAEVEDRLRDALVVDLDAGFADVVRVHERVVYSVALRLTRRREDAEDVAADAFLRAYRALRRFDAARIRVLRLRPWLLTILRNTARNAVRDAGRRPGPALVSEPVDGVAAGPSVEEQVEADHAQRAWGELLARLPETQRTAVVLRHVEDLQTGEVAEVLGCPEGTAKSHISRGLKKLRALLADDADGPPGSLMIEPPQAATSGRTVR
ncbi:RNA polymerase sigma factor [Pseudonocardia adelaidensis]|uniref:RNA polymerase sigma-70 factor (ECF subfamily) n=1 Tax=Pseudonocardia adelaidensis TaxID=648754 RepID=A0ABP9P798_9PSEU